MPRIELQRIEYKDIELGDIIISCLNSIYCEIDNDLLLKVVKENPFHIGNNYKLFRIKADTSELEAEVLKKTAENLKLVEKCEELRKRNSELSEKLDILITANCFHKKEKEEIKAENEILKSQLEYEKQKHEYMKALQSSIDAVVKELTAYVWKDHAIRCGNRPQRPTPPGWYSKGGTITEPIIVSTKTPFPEYLRHV